MNNEKPEISTLKVVDLSDFMPMAYEDIPMLDIDDLLEEPEMILEEIEELEMVLEETD